MVVQKSASQRSPKRSRRGIGIAAAVIAVGLLGWVITEPASAGPISPPAAAVLPADAVAPVVSRISGADRFELAVEIAKRVTPWAANTVYLASGVSFPDALSAGPAAAANAAPLLLVAQDAVPDSVAAALVRINPTSVVLVGGPATVSDRVLATVRSILPRALVKRIAGADRYAVSRSVISDAFPAGAASVVVATGRDFPDALSAGAAAGAGGSPVLLVDGLAPVADDATKALVRDLGASVATVVGGPLSVSTGVQGTILAGGWVPRISGSSRYEVSLNVFTSFSADFGTVYLVSGASFPDALAGGVLAAKTNAPMFVVPGDCVPQGVLSLMADRGTLQVQLIGGPATLGAGVAALVPCSF